MLSGIGFYCEQLEWLVCPGQYGPFMVSVRCSQRPIIQELGSALCIGYVPQPCI